MKPNEIVNGLRLFNINVLANQQSKQYNEFYNSLLLEINTGNREFQTSNKALNFIKLDNYINGNYFAYLTLNNIISI